MRSAGRQSGLSIISFLFVVVVALVVTVVGFRVLPAYIEYFSVKSALVQSASTCALRENVGTRLM